MAAPCRVVEEAGPMGRDFNKAGTTDPTTVWTQQETIPTALRAYEAFDRRDPGWTKVTLEVG